MMEAIKAYTGQTGIVGSKPGNTKSNGHNPGNPSGDPGYSPHTATTQPSSAVAATANKQNEQVTSAQSKSINLSDRSQKLLAINREFFNGHRINFADIPRYINSLHQHGLINDAQFKQLGGQASENNTSSEDLELISDFVSRSLESLKQTDPGSKLIEPLQLSELIFEKLEAGLNVSQQELNTAKQTLTRSMQRDRPEDSELSEQERLFWAGLNKVDQFYQALDKQQTGPALQYGNLNNKAHAYNSISLL